MKTSTSAGEKYLGWANRSTWAVSLWLNNEEATNEMLDKIANGEGNNYDKSQQLKENVEEMAPDLGATLWADLLTHALGKVDWLEIIEKNKQN